MLLGYWMTLLDRAGVGYVLRYGSDRCPNKFTG